MYRPIEIQPITLKKEIFRVTLSTVLILEKSRSYFAHRPET